MPQDGRPGAVPTSIPSRKKQIRELDESVARSFDSFSKSVPVTMPFLEAEPAPIFLPPHGPAAGASAHDGMYNRKRGGSKNEEEPGETSSLLDHSAPDSDYASTRQQVAGVADDAVAAAAAAAPKTEEAPVLYLGGVSPGRFWFIFVQVLASLFIGCFDSTLMASSHPVITSYFGAANSASWLSTSYLLTSTAFQPLLGRLSDSIGRKPLFIGCIGVLTVATAWCGLAQSLSSFIAARAFCGLGAGGSIALGSIVISDLVPIERRGSYQSIVNAMWGLGTAIGAATGGALAESIGWRWEFGIQVPALIIIFVTSSIAIPGDIGIQGKPAKTVLAALREFDVKGSVLLTISTTVFILGLNLGGNILPWSDPIVVASLSTFAIAFPTFLWVQSRAAKPIMPLHLITKMPHANLIFGNFLAAVVANAVLFNMPLYFQAVLLTTATTSGLRLVVPSISTSVVGVSTGFLISYTRRLKWPLVAGTAFNALGSTVLCLFLRRGLLVPLYTLALVPGSIGTGFQFPGTTMAILASSPQADQAVVTSTLLLWRSLGGVLGVATSSLVVQNALLHYLRQLVRGDLRDDVIDQVRKSVEIVAKLDEPYREQVIQSYEATLRLTFLFTAILAIAAFLLTIPVKLVRLPPRK